MSLHGIEFQCDTCGDRRAAPNNELTTACGSSATLWCGKCREITQHSAAAKEPKTVKLERVEA